MHGGSAHKNCEIFWRNWPGAWQPKLRNSQRELEVGCWVTSIQNYTIPRGNQQLATRSLAAKTMQFIEGIGSWLLGRQQQKLHNSQGEQVFSYQELLAKETTLRLRGQSADHLYTIFELSGLLGNGRLAHENFAISLMSNKSTIGRTDLENFAIF